MKCKFLDSMLDSWRSTTHNGSTIIALTYHLGSIYLVLVKDLLDVCCQTGCTTTFSMYIGKKRLIDTASLNISLSEDYGKLFTFTASLLSSAIRVKNPASCTLSQTISRTMSPTVFLNLRWGINTLSLDPVAAYLEQLCHAKLQAIIPLLTNLQTLHVPLSQFLVGCTTY